MKRLLMLVTLFGGCLFFSGNTSQADGFIPVYSPYASHGYGWLQSHALNKFQRIHAHGPLYNYGPYDVYGGGYMFQNPTQWQLRNYIPNAQLYQSLGGYGAPIYGGVVESAPVAGCADCGGSVNGTTAAPARRFFNHR